MKGCSPSTSTPHALSLSSCALSVLLLLLVVSAPRVELLPAECRPCPGTALWSLKLVLELSLRPLLDWLGSRLPTNIATVVDCFMLACCYCYCCSSKAGLLQLVRVVKCRHNVVLEVNLGNGGHSLNINVQPCAIAMLLSVPDLHLQVSSQEVPPDHTASLSIASSCAVT